MQKKYSGSPQKMLLKIIFAVVGSCIIAWALIDMFEEFGLEAYMGYLQITLIVTLLIYVFRTLQAYSVKIQLDDEMLTITKKGEKTASYQLKDVSFGVFYDTTVYAIIPVVYIALVVTDLAGTKSKRHLLSGLSSATANDFFQRLLAEQEAVTEAEIAISRSTRVYALETERVFKIDIDTGISAIPIFFIAGIVLVLAVYLAINTALPEALGFLFVGLLLMYASISIVKNKEKKRENPELIIVNLEGIIVNKRKYLFAEMDEIYYTPSGAEIENGFRRLTLLKDGKKVMVHPVGKTVACRKQGAIYQNYDELVEALEQYTAATEVIVHADLTLQYS